MVRVENLGLVRCDSYDSTILLPFACSVGVFGIGDNSIGYIVELMLLY